MQDGTGIIENIISMMPSAMALLNVVISVMAVFFFIYGMVKFAGLAKRDGTIRPGTPWLLLLAGVMLWNFTSAADSALETIFGSGTSTDTLLSYTAGDSIPEETSRMLGMLIMCIRLYGYYAFARGWFKVTKIGAGTAASEGAFGSASMHILGGALAINIVATVNGVTSALGFGDVL
ncbi:MAG: hypothetical protein WKF61_00360 [Luteimonas sp.]